MHPVEQGSAFEEPSGIFLLQREQFSGGLSEAGEQKMDSPHLALVLEAVLAHQLQLVVDPFLFEGAPRGVEGRGICIDGRVRFR